MIFGDFSVIFGGFSVIFGGFSVIFAFAWLRLGTSRVSVALFLGLQLRSRGIGNFVSLN